MQEKLEMELKKQTDEAASKVAAVLQRAEEQECMIESLHTSVSLFMAYYFLVLFFLSVLHVFPLLMLLSPSFF